MATADGNPSYQGRKPIHETLHDDTGDASLSETVIDAVAAAEGVEPTNADFELYRAVDLEALDALFERRSRDGRWRFEFTIDGLLVTIAGDGRVTVWGRE
ncbi:HalOD1 output domain-containing protein [Halorussus sp. AFM4]|uniref:HalOD1 output domain-containing protein n=1 Tax=Halorussus sp. AFM4 TaxID=3421651 RepID=UPI003EC0A2BB